MTITLKTPMSAQKQIARNFYKPRERKWNWMAHLTKEEAAILEAADAAKKVWLELNKERATITNRAIQRAKYLASIDKGSTK